MDFRYYSEHRPGDLLNVDLMSLERCPPRSRQRNPTYDPRRFTSSNSINMTALNPRPGNPRPGNPRPVNSQSVNPQPTQPTDPARRIPEIRHQIPFIPEMRELMRIGIEPGRLMFTDAAMLYYTQLTDDEIQAGWRTLLNDFLARRRRVAVLREEIGMSPYSP